MEFSSDAMFKGTHKCINFPKPFTASVGNHKMLGVERAKREGIGFLIQSCIYIFPY